MKVLLNTIKLISVLALVSSCAYEPDPGLTPKDAKAGQLDNDPLKGKTASDILKIKYSSLKAECTLTRVEKMDDPADPVVPEEIQTVEGVTPPVAPVLNEGPKTTIDFKLVAAADDTLSKPIEDAQLILGDMNSGEGGILKLVINPVSFKDNLTLKMGTKVYVMKHSPELSGKFNYAYNNGTTIGYNEGEFTALQEKVEFNKLVYKEEVVASKKTFEHMLSCMMSSEVDPKNETVKNQWISVDCTVKPEPAQVEETKVYEANCKETPADPLK